MLNTTFVLFRLFFFLISEVSINKIRKKTRDLFVLCTKLKYLLINFIIDIKLCVLVNIVSGISLLHNYYYTRIVILISRILHLYYCTCYKNVIIIIHLNIWYCKNIVYSSKKYHSSKIWISTNPMIIIIKKKFVAVFQSNEILKISINSNMHARMHRWLEAIMCVFVRVLENIPYGMYSICVFCLFLCITIWKYK